jgi:microcystin-dependent protein
MSYKGGQSSGEETHLLTLLEMPTHDHGLQFAQHGDYLRGNGGYVGTETMGRDTARSDPKFPVTRFTELAGGGQPHNILPPFIAIFYCQKS